MKKIIFLFMLIPFIGTGQAIKVRLLKTVTTPPVIKDSDLVVIDKKDSTANVSTTTAYWVDVKTYMGFNVMPQVLFTHFADAFSSGSTETILYNDSIPGANLITFGNVINAFYCGLDSANNADTLMFYVNGTNILKEGFALAKNWRVDVRIMRYGSGTVKYDIYSTFKQNTTNPSPEYQGIVSGLTFTGNISFKLTGKATGTRQIQARQGKLTYSP